ncbi:MAG: DinB family protein [Dehalococcoidia bacterium]
MTPDLLDPFRHNTWANQELLGFCRDLSDDELAASVPGTFGSIVATFNHILDSEASYHFRLTERRPTWDWRTDDTAEVAVLEARAEEMAALWDDLLRNVLDVDRTVTIHRDRVSVVPVGVILTQTLNHGNEHRAHICTILGATGREPPELGGWDYGFASGRAMWLPTE